jgi:hypothetical protein
MKLRFRVATNRECTNNSPPAKARSSRVLIPAQQSCCTSLSRLQLFVIVKFPESVQPLPPVRDHVPVIVSPLTVPVSDSVLPLGDPDTTLSDHGVAF